MEKTEAFGSLTHVSTILIWGLHWGSASLSSWAYNEMVYWYSFQMRSYLKGVKKL